MRQTLTLLGILLSFQVFSQFNYTSVQHHLELNQISQFKSSLIESESSISYSSYAADDIIWSEDFVNGLTGNNTSTNQAWTVADPNNGSISYLYETAVFDLGNQTGSWFNIMINPAMELTAGQIILHTIYAQAATSNNDTIWVSTSGINYVNAETLAQDIDGVQANVDPGTWLYSTGSGCIRLNFDKSATGLGGVDILENERFAKINIFPNPNSGIFNIRIQTEQPTDFNLNITNILGQSVYQQELSKVSVLDKEINLSKVEKGLYFVNVESKNGKSNSHKIVVK